ncbi:FAD-dependent monooxygenase [Embleya sp. NPDC020886]|uniref:FAD-dependent monooxygenase n=1 Tax=Embleya sp. NPDC020886 TaxID=3363980 RepID=UPI00378C4B72
MATGPTATPVLIVGGGPVGLTLSALLSDQGVDHLLVEAHPTTAHHPKARGIAARSMEILRRLGLEAEVRRAGLPASQVFFYRGRDLVDPDFVRTGVVPADSPDAPQPERTPAPGLICSQDVLEPILLGRARAAAGEDRIRFGTRLVSCTDEGDHVRAVLVERAGGRRYTVCADWLVGCDGAGSPVRAGAGIGMQGPTGLGHFLSVRFDAPLGAVVADRASASYFLTPPGRGGFMAVDNDRRWIHQYPFDPEQARDDEDFTDPRRLEELIRVAAGIADLDVRVRDTMVWRMDARLADAYRSGRILLAGDAAHVIPPTGGHGMNTGIGDADNLAWKLAAVVAGRATPALLDSYQAERRAPAREVIELSRANAAARSGYRIDDELLLDVVYRSTAVVPDPDDPHRPESFLAHGRAPVGPGHRLPHTRLIGPPGITSTLDLLAPAPGFTLIIGADEPAWRRQAEVAEASGSTVVVRVLDGGPVREREPGTFQRVCGVPATGAVLVRPDGHLAWRAPHPPAGPELLAVLRRVLSAPTRPTPPGAHPPAPDDDSRSRTHTNPDS